MNSIPEDIFVNSYQYTPVYLIQSPGATQANSYLITQGNVETQKPINNLKAFYENSSQIAESVLESDTKKDIKKPRILKKQENVTTGNNLKLANFLLPKTNNSNKAYVLSNVVLQPNVTVASNAPPLNNVPKLDIDRKIVKVKDATLIPRSVREKVCPKAKPKENTLTQQANPTKLTSVQLLKLGETYHSLNHLSEDQMKMVNQALKIFSDTEKIAPEPTYDPVTNTQFIYKVVSPKDLTVVGKNKIIVKENKKNEIRKEVVVKKPIFPKEEIVDESSVPELLVETKVTRSGRKVKLPKPIVPEETPHKPKRKNTIANCFQCSAEFSSIYRLQKHYEFHPTHIPAKIHSNLFHCLLAIIKGGSPEDRTNIFIQQLEQLIVKLKSLLPCLLKFNENSGKDCTIGEDIARLFGLDPGKYNINVDALTCVKDKDGYCVHNPPQKQSDPVMQEPQASAPLLNPENITTYTEDCARINSVEKWPTVNKRIWKLKQQKSDELKVKRRRMNSEGDDTLIELGIEDFNVLESVANVQNVEDECVVDAVEEVSVDDRSVKEEMIHAPFHSAHFDIRFSPIKPSATVFRKFQINTNKLVELQKLSSSPVKDSQRDCIIPNDVENSINDLLKDIDFYKETEPAELNLKDWTDKSECGTRLNNIFEQSLERDPSLEKEISDDCAFDKNSVSDNKVIELKNECNSVTNNGEVLNFLDSLNNCLSYPSTEIRNHSMDFQMDLFSYNS